VWVGIVTEKEKISLKEYFDTRMKDADAFFDARIRAIEKSAEIAATELGRRLEGMNEFRGQLKDQAATFITRTEHEAVCKEIEELKLSKANLEGKASQTSFFVTLGISVIGVIISIVALFAHLAG
jgi:hypothetical protein